MKARHKVPNLTLWFVGIALSLMVGYAQDAPNQKTHGIVVANMNRTAKPGDDFNQYANGDWIKRTEIPSDRRGVSVSTPLSDLSDKRTATLIRRPPNPALRLLLTPRKIADLYKSYMDEATIEAKGLAPLRPHLDAIAAIRDRRDLAHALGEGLRADVDPLNNTNFHTTNIFGLWVSPGFSDSEHYTAYLLQGGLELPDREYYLSGSESMRNIRVQFQAHVSTMLKLAGFSRRGCSCQACCGARACHRGNTP